MNVAGFKKFFFDRAAVDKAVDAGLKKAFSRFGAFVRRRAQTSIRRRARSSPPGRPPSSHEGTLRKLIFFGYDPHRRSVVIGPALGGAATGAPRVLEYGGDNTVRAGRDRGQVRRYAARPFMTPAFQAELKRVGESFKNLIA